MPRPKYTPPPPLLPNQRRTRVTGLSASRRQIMNMAGPGELPLAYLLRTMRDKRAKIERRDWAAQHAAPYIHPRLSQVEVMHTLTDAELDEMIASSANQLGIPLDLVQGKDGTFALGAAPPSPLPALPDELALPSTLTNRAEVQAAIAAAVQDQDQDDVPAPTPMPRKRVQVAE